MTSFDPPDPIECPACHGEEADCAVCHGDGFVSPYAQTDAEEDFAETLAAYFRPSQFNGQHVGDEAIIAQKLDLIANFIGWLR